MNQLLQQWDDSTRYIHDTTLYHGTWRFDFISYISTPNGIKHTWFSVDEHQSEIHPFHLPWYKEHMDYPGVYRFRTTPNRYLKLLNLHVVKDNGKEQHMLVPEHGEHAIPLMSGYMKTLCDADEWYSTSGADNSRILDTIDVMNMYINSIGGVPYDGYICLNDQYEVALTYDDASHVLDMSHIDYKALDLVNTLYQWYDDGQWYGGDTLSSLRKSKKDIDTYSKHVRSLRGQGESGTLYVSYDDLLMTGGSAYRYYDYEPIDVGTNISTYVDQVIANDNLYPYPDPPTPMSDDE